MTELGHGSQLLYDPSALLYTKLLDIDVWHIILALRLHR